jgi:hypothetical protein
MALARTEKSFDFTGIGQMHAALHRIARDATLFRNPCPEIAPASRQLAINREFPRMKFFRR